MKLKRPYQFLIRMCVIVGQIFFDPRAPPTLTL